MFVLIEIKGTETKVELYKEIKDAENQMKIRYHKLIQKAKEIDWRYTWIDMNKRYAKIDGREEIYEWRIALIS